MSDLFDDPVDPIRSARGPRAVVMVGQLRSALGKPNVADPRPPSAVWDEALTRVAALAEEVATLRQALEEIAEENERLRDQRQALTELVRESVDDWEGEGYVGHADALRTCLAEAITNDPDAARAALSPTGADDA